jgi:hypothetical protein
MDERATDHTTAWLLDKVRSGDDDARSALVARVEPLLRRFARGRVPLQMRHQEDTADLVQLTWRFFRLSADDFDQRFARIDQPPAAFPGEIR